MGKGNRNSQKHAAEQIKNSEKLAAQQKKANSKKKTEKATSIALAVFAVIIVAVLALSIVSSAGVFIRSEVALSTENVTVDSAMMNFFYNNYLANWYSSYSSYINAGYFSLNPSTSLKLQTFGAGYEYLFLGEYDGTWYDYFLDAVLREVKNYVTYAEGAIAAGITLSDEDYAEIDELIKATKKNLKASGAKLADWYGKGVNASDIRRAYELVYRANKFYEQKIDQLESALKENDAALHEYVKNNKSSFYTADVLKYTITTNSNDFESDEAFDAQTALAMAEANKIAAATTAEEFLALVKAYELANKTIENATDNKVEDLADITAVVNYTETGDLGKWLFVEEADVAATKVINVNTPKTETVKVDGKDTEVPYEQHTATIYFVVEPSHLDTELTKDGGYFIADDKALVEAFYNKVNGTKMTADEFQKAADEYFEEIHAGHDHEDENAVEPAIGYTGFAKLPDGQMTDKSFGSIGTWLDANDREDNTYSAIVEIAVDEKTTYYGFGYFAQYNDEAWYASAFSATISDQFTSWADNQEKNVTPVTVNNKAVSNNITTIAWTTGATDSHEGHDHE